MLRLSKISKSYGSAQALVEADLVVKPGEIVAVLGQNGAGKSTLMRVISGAEQPDSGTIEIDSRRINRLNPQTAMRLGIAMICQEFSLCPHLSVAENLTLGREPNAWGWLKGRRQYAEASVLSQRAGLQADLDRPVARLTVAQQQLTEIAKALGRAATFLVLDEPTAALSQPESERLFGLMRELKGQRVGMVFITHRLREAFEIADRIVVLRDGRTVFESSQTTPEQVIEHMLGRKSEKAESHRNARSEERQPVLEHDHRGFRWAIDRGEILGIAGLVGSGRTSLLRSILHRHPAGYLPEDRKRFGLALSRSLKDNLTLGSLHRHGRAGWIDQKSQGRAAKRMVERLAIRSQSVEQPVSSLSGGNQQKALLGRLILAEHDLLLLDEPTRGVDAGAKAEIHRLIRQLADDGKAVVLVSSELEEVFALSDRILAMRDGRILGEYAPQAQDEVWQALLG